MGKVVETVADSIAIEIINKDTILTGKGNELHLLKQDSDKVNVVWRQQVLDTVLTNKVHGIRKGQTDIILVYGEKEFILLTCHDRWHDSKDVKEFYRASLTDWISSGVFVMDPQELILLTAHSIVLRFDYDVSRKSCSLKERISCTDKSTLYCAHLYGSTWTEIVVFAGNAFGELLVWQPSQNEENREYPKKPKVSSLIHRITAHNGVIFSIDFNHESRQLITTSDDRAVKWWRVTWPQESSSWRDSRFQALASGYGHVARVFQGRIIKNGTDIYALSVGEDSYFCLWRNNGELVFKRRQQYGAPIWNFIYEPHGKTIYTVGSTGNLVAYGLRYILNRALQPQVTLLPEIKTTNLSEYVAKVKFLNDNEIVGITNENRLKRFSLNARVQADDDSLFGFKLDFKCTVMELYGNRLAIGGYKRLFFTEWNEDTNYFETILNQEVLDGVIRAIVFFSTTDFIVCDDKGNCLIYKGSESARYSLKLPQCKEPWLTTALLLHQDQYILISNRQGNLLLYKLADEEFQYKLSDIIKHPHGNLGATELRLLNEGTNEALVRSSGHDGALITFSICFKISKMKTCSREIIPVAWVEHIQTYLRGQDIFLGFNDNHFVVWSREFDFLIQLACGGGHRSWHFTINPHDYQISLVFIKNKRIHFYRLPLVNKELVSLPPAKKWHIAPCNIIQTLQDIHDETTIAVSAGDDNLIKIHTLRKTGLVRRQELHQHISNVRALKVLCLNNEEFLIFSGGGRAQLCITKVNKKNFQTEELLNYTLKEESNDKSSPSRKEYNFNPETRLMTLDVKVLDNYEYQLYIGCSDGYIQTLSINLATLQMKQLTHYFYSKCVLQVKYIPEYNYVLAAGTDGLIKFFDSNLSQCLEERKHHSSGVNALSVMFDSKRKTLKILSGGDDQSISYSEFDLKDGFKLLDNFYKPYIHSAQVCAAAISSNGLYGYTSGVDQMLYKFELTSGKLVERFHSCVADIKGVCLLKDDLCLLYGCGFQIYSFTSE